MELKAKRQVVWKERTLGTLYVDGKALCETVEDLVRDLGPDGEGKIPGRTAIPAGRYEVVLHPVERLWSPHGRLLPMLLGVPHFTEIFIHAGNTEEDTEGCIIVGVRQDMLVVRSRSTLKILMGVMKYPCWITVEN